MSYLFPPNSFFFFLPPNLSFWARTPPPRSSGTPAPRVPRLIESPHPHPGPAGAGDGWCPAIGLPRGKGWGAPGQGEGSALGGRPSRELGRLRPRARGGDGSCSPSWPNYEPSWPCVSRLPPRRSLCVPAGPCPSPPVSSVCLCVSQAVCSCPAASFVPLCVSDICPFVRPTVFVRPKPLNICHCLSLRFRVSLPARVCLPVRSVSLSVPCPCFSVWLRPDSWALFQ